VRRLRNRKSVLFSAWLQTVRRDFTTVRLDIKLPHVVYEIILERAIASRRSFSHQTLFDLAERLQQFAPEDFRRFGLRNLKVTTRKKTHRAQFTGRTHLDVPPEMLDLLTAMAEESWRNVRTELIWHLVRHYEQFSEYTARLVGVKAPNQSIYWKRQPLP
jgi:hypothetical protein